MVNKKYDLSNKLISIARSMEKVGDRMLSKFGLTMRIYEIMININSGINTNLELSKIMQSTPASIAQKTKILEDKKLIKRIVSSEDKRIWQFSLTKKGNVIFNQAQNIFNHANPHLYSKYSEKEKHLIADFIDAIEDHLDFLLKNKNKIDEFINKFIGGNKK